MKKLLSFVTILFFLLHTAPVNAIAQEELTWKNETIYYLLIDRFNNGNNENDFNINVEDSNAFHGGDFQGIITKLDYLKEMGFTTIRLSPIFDNDADGYHGYNVIDFSKTDEHFGTIATFKKLVKEAHDRDLKIIVDIPVIKQEKDYIMYITNWWINETKVDGYYWIFKDAADWQEFSKDLKAKYGNRVLGNIPDLQLDKQMEILRTTFAKPDVSMKKLIAITNKSNNIETPTFLDDHTTERFTKLASSTNQYPGTRWKLALTYLYTTPGIPMVYYGSEIALNGAKTPDNRRDINFRTDKELIEFITQIGEARQKYPSLTNGDMEVLYEKNGMLIFKRQYHNELSLIAINNTSKTEKITLSEKVLARNKELRGLLNPDVVRSKNDQFHLVLDRETAEIYIVSNQSGLNIPLILAVVVVYIAFMIFILIIRKRSKQSNYP